MKIDDKTSHNSPSLRFPEFTGEWEKCKIEDITDAVSSGKSKNHFSNGEYNLYGSTGIIGRTDKALYDGKLVLVARVGANAGFLQIINEPCGITDNTLILKPKGIDAFYLYYFLQHFNLNRLIFGSGQPLITGGMLKKVKVSLGTISEQSKIVKFLSLLDERIAVQNRLIDRLQSLIKGIMVKLQQQGLSKGTWKRVPLSSILKERTELNEGLLPVYSVSVSQGVVNQMEYLGRSFAAKDTSKYHVAHFGDLIYTKSPTGSFPYGIVKQNSNRYKVAVSPLYGVYTPANYFTGVFLQEYFKSEVNTFNYLHSLIQKGAKNTINITNQRFLDNYILIPTDSNDLQQISNLLLRLNANKDLMQNMLQQYQEQKQYLLRQMFI